MRAHADQIVDVGGIADATDDVLAQFRAPGVDSSLVQRLREEFVHLLLGVRVAHDDDVGHRQRRRRTLQNAERAEDREEEGEVIHQAETFALVEHLVLAP